MCVEWGGEKIEATECLTLYTAVSHANVAATHYADCVRTEKFFCQRKGKHCSVLHLKVLLSNLD